MDCGELLSFSIPTRIIHCIQNSTVQNIERDKWSVLAQRIESLEEYGARRDIEDAKVRLDFISQMPDLRTGRKFQREIVWGGQMTLGDCCARDFSISLLRYQVIDYGDIIPASWRIQQIPAFAQNGGNVSARYYIWRQIWYQRQ